MTKAQEAELEQLAAEISAGLGAEAVRRMATSTHLFLRSRRGHYLPAPAPTVSWDTDLPQWHEPDAVLLFHGGVRGLVAGDFILPPATTGIPTQDPQAAGDAWTELAVRNKRADSVYFTPVLATARAYAGVVSSGGAVYEVEPCGEIELDADPNAGLHNFRVAKARVLRIVMHVPPIGDETWARWFPQIEAIVKDSGGALFEALLPLMPATDSSLHGRDHWRRVARNGLTLAAATPDAYLPAVQAFAALHDAYRRSDGADPDHGARAAAAARKLHRAGTLRLGKGHLKTLCVALEQHADGLVSDDATIGVCWDADRLELPRVGCRVDQRYLSTTAAREILTG